MSYYLGISSLDCDSTITILKDGRIIYASQEERFTRVKQQKGFPYEAIKNAFEYLKISISDIESISYGWFDPEEEKRLYQISGKKVIESAGWRKASILRTLRNRLNLLRRTQLTYNEIKESSANLIKGLNDIGYKKELKRFHHQDCHAASAYYTSGFEKCLIFTFDGYGSGSCGGIFLAQDSKIETLQYINSSQSIGAMYARATKALGFIPNRHEGKILGLAAYGNPDMFFEHIMKDFELTPEGYNYYNALDPLIYKEIFKTGSKEDLAASFQKVLETVAVHVVKQYVKTYKISKVCLVGGVAANVKMNQRIMEIEDVQELYVHPGMSDCGIATGAAFLDAAQKSKLVPYKLEDVFLGPDFSEDEILRAIIAFDHKYEKLSEIENRIAELLADGKVVGRYTGRMEYGPRALCNRTIFAPTNNSDINKWLNKRLNRTEFMPFAPVTLDYMADKMYFNIEKVRYTSKFMTTTVDCTDEMKQLSPAAVHIDGTARPQLVSPNYNPSAFKVLERYYQLTGIPSLVNTSYNMHEEPIICNPHDAVKAFKDGRLDYLAIGDYLLKATD
jgi:carbamoyltransferase